MKNISLFLLFFLTCSLLSAQGFTRQDSLRGTLSPLRSCYDVYYYDLQIRVVPEKKYIQGSNTFYFTNVNDFDKIQIDLFKNLNIEKITCKGLELKFVREGNATFVSFPEKQKKGEKGEITVYYSGKPRIAVNAPWDGGFSWAKDKTGSTWIGVSCEGLGASVWWPNKDHLSEEPDSMRISCEVPSELICVANGRLRKEEKLKDKYTRYDWFVSYPINNYNVTLNIAKYEHFSEVYTAEDGEKLDLDYYVLPYNLNKAKKQFEQVKPMLACYEKLFGKYPFWNDGFKLVETPYLGMEHQGAIAYGNEYMQGYKGYDLSGTGIGRKFDYIIIHESGHEYWGNSVSCNDHAEMWIHESFCTYTEGLYVECMFGKKEAYAYLNGLGGNISNTSPILGPLGVNGDGSGDMYSKGAVILHTLRNVIDNDELWFKIIKGITTEFKIKNVNTKDIVDYISKMAGEDYSYFFEQYLAYASPPVLEYKINAGKKGEYLLEYKWKAHVADFHMPIQIRLADGSYFKLKPTTQWQKTTLKLAQGKVLLPENHDYFFMDQK